MTFEMPTSRDVVGWLNEIRTELAQAVGALAEADEAAIMARETEELAYARVLVELGDEGTVSERDARAKIRCADERFLRITTEQQLRAAKERVKKARDELDVIRSLNSAVNTEWRTQAMGQPA